MDKSNYVILFLNLAVISCGVIDNAPSEDEIRKKFNDEVSLSTSCSTDNECVIIVPGCPLGCNIAVNIENQERLETLAEDLISDFQSGGRGCSYNCIQQYPVCNIDECETREF